MSNAICKAWPPDRYAVGVNCVVNVHDVFGWQVVKHQFIKATIYLRTHGILDTSECFEAECAVSLSAVLLMLISLMLRCQSLEAGLCCSCYMPCRRYIIDFGVQIVYSMLLGYASQAHRLASCLQPQLAAAAAAADHFWFVPPGIV